MHSNISIICMTWQFARITNQASQTKQENKSKTRITSMAFLLRYTKSSNTWQELNSIKLNLITHKNFIKTTMFNLLKFPIVI